ncbi:MAG: sigma-70 family RNA polymerase sigma factor [Planctomycetaceae bacterium]
MSAQTRAIQGWVERLKEGDATARDGLLRVAEHRLMILTRKMKRGYGKVGRWEQTEDVYQGAIMRLHQALVETEINDLQHFLRLAALQIRRELIDLARKHQGAGGFAGNHASQAGVMPGDASQVPFDPAELTHDPAAVQEWGEFHEVIEQLPEEQRSVVDLLFYHGMSQDEAAEVLATSVRTIKRHWRAARLTLFEKLGGALPGE